MDENNMIQQPVFQEGETGVAPKKEPQEEALESSLAKKRLDNEAEKGRRGWLGAIWGDGNNSAINIAGLLIVLLVSIGAVYTFVMLCKSWQETHLQVLDFWKIIVPLITLALGYLFGKRRP